MARAVRKLRHWKQRWSKGAEFIWRRRITYAGETTVPGDPLPDELKNNPTKLRRFWESHVIELAQFEEPDVATGQRRASLRGAPTDGLPDGVVLEALGGSWTLVRTPGEPDGVKVNGRKALERLLEELRVEADGASEDYADDAEQAGAEEAEGDDASAEEGVNAEPDGAADEDFLK